jgi:hypothetical protein
VHTSAIGDALQHYKTALEFAKYPVGNMFADRARTFDGQHWSVGRY